jgi:hypothetical protein
MSIISCDGQSSAMQPDTEGGGEPHFGQSTIVSDRSSMTVNLLPPLPRHLDGFLSRREHRSGIVGAIVTQHLSARSIVEHAEAWR